MAKRYYEGMFLFDSGFVAKEPEGPALMLADLAQKHGFDVESMNKWDDRRLAYEIKGKKRGSYYVAVVQMEPQSVAAVRRDMQYANDLLRFVFVQEDKLHSLMAERVDLAERRDQEAAQTGEIYGRRGRDRDRERRRR